MSPPASVSSRSGFLALNFPIENATKVLLTGLVNRSFSQIERSGATGRCSCRGAAPLLFAHLQQGEERLLRNVDFADALHPLLAFLLLFEQFALAADIAAVALGDNILADRGDRLSRNDL